MRTTANTESLIIVLLKETVLFVVSKFQIEVELERQKTHAFPLDA